MKSASQRSLGNNIKILQRIKKSLLIITLIGLFVYNFHQYSKIESTILGLIHTSNTATGTNVSDISSASLKNTKFVPQLSTADGEWILPNTSFTPHITTLVNYYKSNYYKCHAYQSKGGRGGVAVQIKTSGSRPIAKQIGKGYGKFNIGKWLNQLLSKQQYLPQNKNVTILFSRSDYNSNKTLCQFANSSPNGQHSVFNHQDMNHLVSNITYPMPLPWNERKSIPVFRGSNWGFAASFITKLKHEFDMNRKQNESLAKETFFSNITKAPDAIYGRDNTRYQRLPLVYFSKQHPELIDARLTKPKSDPHSLWDDNATNGLDRVLPFDSIPQEKYYTEYQVHIIMGGYGAAFRTARILNQEIAVVLQDYPYEAWFKHIMKPYEHYIPLHQNISNLNETLHWIQDNPKKVHEIAKNGKRFHDKYLAHERIEEFYYELIFRLLVCCGGVGSVGD